MNPPFSIPSQALSASNRFPAVGLSITARQFSPSFALIYLTFSSFTTVPYPKTFTALRFPFISDFLISGVPFPLKLNFLALPLTRAFSLFGYQLLLTLFSIRTTHFLKSTVRAPPQSQ